MKIPRKDQIAIKRHLLEKGAIVIEDKPTGNHDYLDMLNSTAWNYMKKLHSLGYVDRTFNWRHAYYFVNDEGYRLLNDELVFSEGLVEQELDETQLEVIKT